MHEGDLLSGVLDMLGRVLRGDDQRDAAAVFGPRPHQNAANVLAERVVKLLGTCTALERKVRTGKR